MFANKRKNQSHGRKKIQNVLEEEKVEELKEAAPVNESAAAQHIEHNSLAERMNNNIQELLIDIDVEEMPSSDEIRDFLINLRDLEACSGETVLSIGGEEGPVLAVKTMTYKK